MKIRMGFVSNSSSASFIVSFKSSKPIEEIKELILQDPSASHLSKPERVLDWGESSKKGEPVYRQTSDGPSIDKYLELDGSTYRFKPSTMMFNSWGDVPGWSFIKALFDGKFEDTEPVSIIQDYSGQDECFHEIEFDYEEQDEYVKYLNNISK